jgi:hypothetical protein
MDDGLWAPPTLNRRQRTSLWPLVLELLEPAGRFTRDDSRAGYLRTRLYTGRSEQFDPTECHPR